MEGNGLKGVCHLARVEKDEPRAVRIACHCRCRPIDVRMSVGKWMAQGQGGPCSHGRIHQTRQFRNRRQPPSFPAAHIFIGAGSTSIGPGQLRRFQSLFPHKSGFIVSNRRIPKVTQDSKPRGARELLAPILEEEVRDIRRKGTVPACPKSEHTPNQ